ncbi:Hypothetical protein EAG7_04596 [Klebsiella aerogenes]|nr:Hypothetical protein EAG7_04596 [Klebsiella aerogenes]CCG33088.1 hypothetical protein [Klebsiella aerogenes EA1509E]
MAATAMKTSRYIQNFYCCRPRMASQMYKPHSHGDDMFID